VREILNLQLAVFLALALVLTSACATGPAQVSCSHGGHYSRSVEGHVEAACEGELSVAHGTLSDNGKSFLSGALGFLGGLVLR
jgi:hypothetical protein